MTKTGANQESEEVAGNDRTEEMITENEGEIRTEKKKRYVLGQRLWQPTHTRGTHRVL